LTSIRKLSEHYSAKDDQSASNFYGSNFYGSTCCGHLMHFIWLTAQHEKSPSSFPTREFLSVTTRHLWASARSGNLRVCDPYQTDG